MVRAFRSELLKLRRWSVLAGGGVMILASAFIAYLTFHQITSGYQRVVDRRKNHEITRARSRQPRTYIGTDTHVQAQR